MPIKFFNQDTNFTLKNRKILKAWVNSAIQDHKKKPGDINYIFTSDNYLLDINKQYLSHDYYTDIITFNYCASNIITGDIYISIDTVRNNSKRFGVSSKEELHRVMIHGILHLLDYDDQNEKQKEQMREKENYYLERLKNLF